MHCKTCTERQQMRYGCQPGTRAQKPFEYEWGTFDRCPIAVLRDVSQAEIGAINWGIEMAVAKRQGSLSAYIAPGTLSARGDSLISAAEETIVAREQEALDRAGDKEPATDRRRRR
jgi:hypothetical protein